MRRRSTWPSSGGPRIVRRPRLILRKSAWVTIRLAGAFVYWVGAELLAEEPRVHRDRLGRPPAARLPGASGGSRRTAAPR